MALQLLTDAVFSGVSDIPARAPLPNDALGYADFTTGGLQITQTLAQMGASANAVILPSSSPAGFYYGQNGLAFSPSGGSLARMEFSGDGEARGLLVQPDYTQRVTSAHRQNLAAGSAVGATVAADGAGPNGWDQFYNVMPTGAGEASLTLTAGAVTTNAFIYIGFEVSGSGVVQIGARGGDADDYANFDLSSGTVTAGGGAVAAMRKVPGGSWFCGIRVQALTSPNDIGPYAASVASAATAKLGAAGAAFRVRAPIVTAGSAGGLPFPSPWGLTTSSDHAYDNIAHSTAMLAADADFSLVMRLRSGWWPHQISAGIAYFYVSSSRWLEIRCDGNNNFIINSNLLGVAYTFGQRWQPSTQYRVGLTRTGSRLTVNLNGERVSLDAPGEVNGATVRLGKGANAATNVWGGHLQRAIFWPPKSDQALDAAVDWHG